MTAYDVWTGAGKPGEYPEWLDLQLDRFYFLDTGESARAVPISLGPEAAADAMHARQVYLDPPEKRAEFQRWLEGQLYNGRLAA